MNTEKPSSTQSPQQNNSRQKEIQFKPITEGLGFHPFSDGLPYASQNPTPKKPTFAAPSTSPLRSNRNTGTMGSGAVSAGRPLFVTPTIPKAIPVAPAQNLTPIPSTYTVGYSLQRAFGYVIDSIFNLSVAATILSFALIQTDVELLQNLSDSSLILSGVFLFLCNWAAIAGQEVAFGTSLGKRVFGLSLPGNGSDAFIRAVAFIPCSLFFGFGIFAGLFDSEKRCWHDRFAHIQPEIQL